MIEIDLLKQYGAVEKQLKKGSLLFEEGDTAFFYYQIVTGSVKMNNYNDQGQETIQGIFKEGQSFGEPAVLGDFPFPANAEAISDSKLICLEKNRFHLLLKEHPKVSLKALAILSKRLRFKAILAKEIKGHEAEHRIITLLNYLKKNSQTEGLYKVDITRQTIANLTGLRVETVIRSIKILKEKDLIIVENRKLFI